MSRHASIVAAMDKTLRPGHGHAFLALALAGALFGCAAPVPPAPAEAAVDVPAAWSADGAAAPGGATRLASWWSRFDDPLLTDLIGQALRANTSVTGAQAALRQARATRDVTAAGLLPTLDGSASAQRARTGNGAAANTFRAGLDASWEPDVFGANRSALDASEASTQASAASLGDIQVSVAAEVALDYIALRSAQARLASARQNLATQLETAQIAQWRLQAGLLSSLEAEQSRAAAEQTSAQLPLLQTSIEQNAHALAVLTGQPPVALSAALAPMQPVPQAADDLALAIPAETLRQRPDVRAAEHQVSAALARVAEADAARLPSFRLSGSLGLASVTLGALTSGSSAVSALAAGVSLPLFDGGAARARVRAQHAALDQAGSVYRSVVLMALKDVEDALVALRGDRERLAHLQAAADAAGNAALFARQRFNGGLVDFQTVLDTQRSQLLTQDSMTSAHADVSADHVRLYKALGGGWLADTGDATAAPAPQASTTPRS